MLLLTGQVLKASSAFYLKINQQGRYTVFLNNNPNTAQQNIFRFNNLLPGNYSIRIVSNNGWNQQNIYQGNIHIQHGIKYAAEYSLGLGFQVVAQIPTMQNLWYMDEFAMNGNSGCNQINPYHSPFYPQNNNHTPIIPSFPNYTPTFPQNSWNQPQIMNSNSFNILLNTVKNTPFDNNKVLVIQTSLKDSFITTAQVKELLNLLSFENNKISVAKYCYEKTVDRQNYFEIYNSFSFSSSIQDLSTYIASR